MRKISAHLLLLLHESYRDKQRFTTRAVATDNVSFIRRVTVQLDLQSTTVCQPSSSPSSSSARSPKYVSVYRYVFHIGRWIDDVIDVRNQRLAGLWVQSSTISDLTYQSIPTWHWRRPRGRPATSLVPYQRRCRSLPVPGGFWCSAISDTTPPSQPHYR